MLEQRAFLRAFGETFADEWKNERLRRADEHPHRDAAAIVTDVMARWPDPVRAARWSIDDEGPPKHGIDRPAGFLLARLRKLPEHPSEDLGDGEDGRGDGGAKRSESPVHIALLLRLEDVVNLWPRVRDRLVGDDGVDVGSAMRSEFGQRLIAGGSRALYPDVMGYSVEHATGQLAVVDDLLAKMRRLKGDTTTTNDAAPPSSPNLTAAPAPPSPGSDR